jgi:hypothetical protein
MRRVDVDSDDTSTTWLRSQGMVRCVARTHAPQQGYHAPYHPFPRSCLLPHHTPTQACRGGPQDLHPDAAQWLWLSVNCEAMEKIQVPQVGSCLHYHILKSWGAPVKAGHWGLRRSEAPGAAGWRLEAVRGASLLTRTSRHNRWCGQQCCGVAGARGSKLLGRRSSELPIPTWVQHERPSTITLPLTPIPTTTHSGEWSQPDPDAIECIRWCRQQVWGHAHCNMDGSWHVHITHTHTHRHTRTLFPSCMLYTHVFDSCPAAVCSTLSSHSQLVPAGLQDHG